jgi:O-antigen/teichoic acid export membrane protein
MSGSQRVARNVLATLGTQIVSWALTFAVTLYLPRYVGAAGLGKLTFAYAFMGVFGVLVPLGTSTVLVKEISRDRARTGELLTAVILMRLPLSIAMMGIAIAVVNLLGYSSLLRLLVILAALGTFAGTLNDALSSALQGLENLPRQSVALLVEKFLSAILTMILIFHREPLWTLGAVGLVTGMVSLLVNLSAFRSLLPSLRLPTWITFRGVLTAGLPFMGWSVFQTLYGQTDPIVLKFMTNDVTVGWYSAAFRLVGSTLFLPTAITTALLPTLSRLYRENEDDFVSLARRMFGIVMLCAVPIFIVLLTMPERLIAMMHYPKEFAGSIPVLRVGSFGSLLWFAGCVLGTLLIARDAQAKMFKLSVWATVLGIPACCLGSWLGNRLCGNGAVGAISSDVALEVFLVASYLRLLPRGMFNNESVLILCRAAAASVPMVLLLTLMSRYTTLGLWALLPSAILYGILCLALRCFGPTDLALARSLIVRKAGA